MKTKTLLGRAKQTETKSANGMLRPATTQKTVKYATLPPPKLMMPVPVPLSDIARLGTLCITTTNSCGSEAAESDAFKLVPAKSLNVSIAVVELTFRPPGLLGVSTPEPEPILKEKPPGAPVGVPGAEPDPAPKVNGVVAPLTLPCCAGTPNWNGLAGATADELSAVN